MKYSCKAFLLFFIAALSTLSVFAQKEVKTDSLKKRPTVALVLSGGGAKGFAEIGTLEAIDELGIPVDYIVGTSMGSVMGGLYAIGYTGKQIAEEVAKQDWSNVFTDEIVSSKTPISKKDELSRYAFSFPIKEGIRLPKGIVRGQEVMNILSKYTIGYHDSIDFEKLPIPYSCIATDLETGEAVILETGNLPLAMRASMSIPSVFTPIEIADRTFIDGGAVNNFPADVAKAKGYDYIIGVDVQSPLLTKKELRSATDVANQIVGFLGKERSDNNIKMTNVYIHPDISKYSTSSFSPEEIDSLIEIGRIAAKSAYPKLLKLKEVLGKNIEKEEHIAPNFNAPIFFKHIDVEGLEKNTKAVFLKKLHFKNQDSILTNDLKQKIDDVSAILDLDLLTYKVDKDTLKFEAHERNNNRFNIGFHYDSDNDASILLNTTWDNILFKNSRASVDAILGKNLEFTARYSIKFGKIPHLNFLFDTKKYSLTAYNFNDKVAEGDLSYVKFGVNTQFVLWDNYSIGLGVREEYVDLDNTLNSLSVTAQKVHQWYTNYYGFIRLNTLDNPNYPTRGRSFNAEVKFVTDGKSEKGTIAYANYKGAINFTKNFGAILNLYGRTLIDNNLNLVYNNYWGGINQTNYLDKHIPFVGANWLQGYNNTMAVSRLDLRYLLFRNNYLILTGNYGRYSSDTDNFFKDSAKDLWGAGLTYSYNSIIGPIEFTVMHSTEVHKPLLHISIGYNF